MGLEDLIKRLGEVTEGSRELDADIAEALSLPPEHAYRRPDHDFGCDVYAFWWAPRCTVSIDAAVVLIPQRHRWMVQSRPQAQQRQDGYMAQVFKEAHPYPLGTIPEAWAATPALALCTAALKARLAIEAVAA